MPDLAPRRMTSTPDAVRMAVMGGGPTGRTRGPLDPLAGALAGTTRPLAPPVDEGRDPTGFRWLYNRVIQPATSPLDLGLEVATGPMPAGRARAALGHAIHWLRQNRPSLAKALEAAEAAAQRMPEGSAERKRLEGRIVKARRLAFVRARESARHSQAAGARAEGRVEQLGQQDLQRSRWMRSAAQGPAQQAQRRNDARQSISVEGRGEGSLGLEYSDPVPETLANLPDDPRTLQIASEFGGQRVDPRIEAHARSTARGRARQFYRERDAVSGHDLDTPRLDPLQEQRSGMAADERRDFRPEREGNAQEGEFASPLVAGDVAFEGLDEATRERRRRAVEALAAGDPKWADYRQSASGRLQRHARGRSQRFTQGDREHYGPLPPAEQAELRGKIENLEEGALRNVDEREYPPLMGPRGYRQVLEQSRTRAGRAAAELDPWTRPPTSAIGDLSQRPKTRMGRFEQVAAMRRRRADPQLESRIAPIVDALMTGLNQQSGVPMGRSTPPRLKNFPIERVWPIPRRGRGGRRARDPLSPADTPIRTTDWSALVNALLSD